MLTTLPVELIHKICESLVSWRTTQNPYLSTSFDVFQMLTMANEAVQYRPPTGLGNLRLVSRDVNAIVSPLVFSEVVFDFDADVNRPRDASLAAHLERVASGKSPLCSATKTLRIVSLYPQHGWSRNGERVIRKWLTEESVHRHLVKAVSCMKNLQHIRIEKLTKWDMKHLSSIVPHLSMLPISQLSMHLSQLVDCTPVFPTPTTLNTLELVLNTGLACSSTCAAAIRDIIQSNPHITALDIHSYYELVADNCQELLVSSPEVSPLKALRRLSITHKFLPGDAAIIKTLTSLESLRLYHMDPNLPAIWDNLRLSGIGLEELHVDSFSRPLLTYLSSFSGLKCFRMVRVGSKLYYLGAPALEDDAQSFIRAVIGLHRTTLTTLNVGVTHWRPFCFNQDFADALASCVHLTECGLTLDYDQGVQSSLSALMTSIASRSPLAKQWKTLTLSSVNTMHKLEFTTSNWQLERKRHGAVVCWLRSFDIPDPDRYPRRIFLPQIDDVPLLVMTNMGNGRGGFKYVKTTL